MKRYIYKTAVFLLAWFSLVSSIPNSIQQNNRIIGVWKLEEDPKSQWEFTRDGKMSSTYLGFDKVYHYTYEINHKTPQCGVEVKLQDGVDFLQITHTKDQDKNCFYIEGLTSTRLTLLNVETGHRSLFIKN